jgi:hypothetical protein
MHSSCTLSLSRYRATTCVPSSLRSDGRRTAAHIWSSEVNKGFFPFSVPGTRKHARALRLRTCGSLLRLTIESLKMIKFGLINLCCNDAEVHRLNARLYQANGDRSASYQASPSSHTFTFTSTPASQQGAGIASASANYQQPRHTLLCIATSLTLAIVDPWP